MEEDQTESGHLRFFNSIDSPNVNTWSYLPPCFAKGPNLCSGSAVKSVLYKLSLSACKPNIQNDNKKDCSYENIECTSRSRGKKRVVVKVQVNSHAWQKLSWDEALLVFKRYWVIGWGIAVCSKAMAVSLPEEHSNAPFFRAALFVSTVLLHSPDLVVCPWNGRQSTGWAPKLIWTLKRQKSKHEYCIGTNGMG